MTIADIKEANRQAGFHFFDKDTMRFFRSIVASGVYEGHEYAYFVTREINPSNELRFTVRAFNKSNGDVRTYGEYFKYRTKDAAIWEAKNASWNSGKNEKDGSHE